MCFVHFASICFMLVATFPAFIFLTIVALHPHPPPYFWPLFFVRTRTLIMFSLPSPSTSQCHLCFPSALPIFLFTNNYLYHVSLCSRWFLYSYIYLFILCCKCYFLLCFHYIAFLSHIIVYPFHCGVPFNYRPVLLILLTCPSASFVVI